MTNGLQITGWMDLLGVPDMEATPEDTIVDWSINYRDEDETSRLIVLIQGIIGDPFCLLGDQRNDRGE